MAFIFVSILSVHLYYYNLLINCFASNKSCIMLPFFIFLMRFQSQVYEYVNSEINYKLIMNISTHPHPVVIRPAPQPHPHLRPVQVTQIPKMHQMNPSTWHSIQPGDPYDIKKSTIKTLDNQTKFMGENPQMILLFQAAEIQRLTESLEEYKNKLKQLSVKELDRHSYEVQIKQLTTVLLQSKELGTQNVKLKDFIKRQATQVDAWKKKLDSTNLSSHSKYQSALKQIQLMMQEKNQIMFEFNNVTHRLNMEKQTLELQLKTLRDNFDIKTRQTSQLAKSVSANNTKMIELNQRSQLSIDYEKRIQQYEVVCGKLNVQIQRLSNLLTLKHSGDNDSQVKFKNMEVEISSMKTSYEQLSRRLEITIKDKTKIHQQFLQMESKYKQYEKQSWKNSQMKSKMRKCHDQIEHLKTNIRSKDIQIQDLVSKKKLLEHQLETTRLSTKNSIEMLQVKIGEMSRTTAQFTEMQITLDSQMKEKQYLQEENHRLKESFRLSTTNIQKINNQLIDVKQKSLELSHQNQQLRARIGGLADTNTRVAENDGRIHLLSQQLQRMNTILQSKDVQINSLARQVSENRNKNQVSLQQNQQYKRKIQELGQSTRKIQESEGRIIILSNEIDRLNKIVQSNQKQSLGLIRKIDQCEGLNRTINTLQEKINKLVNENNVLTSDIKTAQENIVASSNQINAIRSQNQNLKKTVAEFEEEDNRIAQYQHQVQQLSLELERMNQFIEAKDTENSLLLIDSNKIRQMLNKSMAETEQYKRRVGQASEANRKISQYESKIIMLTQDVQRLSGSLESKSTQHKEFYNETIQLRNRYQQIVNQNEILKRKLTEAAEVLRRNSEQEHQIFLLTTEVERMTAVASKKSTDNQKNQASLTQYKLKMNQISQDNEQLKKKLSELAQSKRRIQQHQASIRELERQNQQLNRAIKQKSVNNAKSEHDLVDLQSKLRYTTQENEQLKMKVQQIRLLNQQIMQYQQKLITVTHQVNRLNVMIENKNRILQKEVLQKRQLTQQLEYMNEKNQEQDVMATQMNKLQIKIRDYEERVSLLTSEVKRLNGVVDEKITSSYKVQSQMAQMRIRMNQLELENQQLKRRVAQMKDLKIKLQQYQIKFMAVSHQITRMSNQLEHKTIQNKLIGNELEIQRRKSFDFVNQIQKSKKHITQAQKTNQKVYQYEHRIALMSQEIQRLNMTIDQRNNYSRQSGNEVSDLKLMISQLNQQNDQLKRRIIQTSDVNRKISEYENRIAFLSQEIQRLNTVVQQKDIQFTLMNNQLSQINARNRKYQSELYSYQTMSSTSPEISSKTLMYENQIQILNHQIQNLSAMNQNLRNQVHYLSNHTRQTPKTEYIKIQTQQDYDQRQSQSANTDKLQQYQFQAAQMSKQLQMRQQLIQKRNSQISQLMNINQSLKKQMMSRGFSSQEFDSKLGQQTNELKVLLQKKDLQLQALRSASTNQSELQRKIQNHLLMFVTLFAEIQSLRSRIGDSFGETTVIRSFN